MFSSKPKTPTTPSETPTPPATRPSPPARSSPPSIISKDLKIMGDLVSEGDLQIDGVIEGDLKSRSLTVGESAEIKGSIEADTARIHGTVSGQVKAETIELMRSAKMSGDIIHGVLSIEAGAHVEGTLARLHRDPKAIAPPKSNGASAEEVESTRSTPSGPKVAEAERKEGGSNGNVKAGPRGQSDPAGSTEKSSGVITDDVPNPLSRKFRASVGS
ncbi:MAG: polymer-forming cytoskeletal protein [Alphaproteobacteria bacterium]|nr:polymer-forming cytoskeletal protein [Alphaproteobacteria bacterium]